MQRDMALSCRRCWRPVVREPNIFSLQFIVNRPWRRLIKVGDSRNVRVAIAAALGTLVWGLFLLMLGRSLHAIPVPEPTREQPMQMRLVEIPTVAPPLHAATVGSTQTAPKPPKASPPKQPLVKAARAPTLPVRPPIPARQSETMIRAPGPAAKPDATAPQTATAAAPSTSSDRGATTAERTSAESAPGNSPARAIAQPLPSVPDELREQAYQTVAIARLVIHTDGSVAVELIKPTQYPRLNQIVVETLRSWRFFPAMQDGHPVETRQEIRVHFNVS
ncbi:TonB family protein [Paraburkholderia sp. RAU2J]|uniref:energy transducer TonB n=1 Tax=Paraburkholderia sp. RAU2J TaxID=1938810 RepID=UPI00322012C5